MNKPDKSTDDPDFSLVLGGPLYQLFQRAHLSGDALELARRRIVVIAAVAWVPLLLLSAISGDVLSGAIADPFFQDIEVHVRFLIALPILVAAELIVHARMRPIGKRFIERNLVIPEDLPKYQAAIQSATRLRNSVAVEVGLMVLVYTLGLWLWRSNIASGVTSWYARPDSSGLHLTQAGYWYAYVSIPIFQFILLRWYFRFFLWFQLLWRVSRLNLRLIATHPDRAAGLAFLGLSSYAFAPILFAQGALLSGLIAVRVLYDGQSLMAFKMEAVGFVAFFVAIVLSPLLVFTPRLARAKRDGLREYGDLASRYVQGFDEKWIRPGGAREEELLGSADLQSLADLGNSYVVVREMRFVPFGLKDVIRLAVVTAAPLLPLALTVISLEELVIRLVKILF